MQYDQNDLDNLILVAWKEARGDGADAMRAVMHVIVNRVRAEGFPKTLRSVLTQKNAFSCLNPSDPEFNLQPAEDDTQFAYCKTVAPDVLDGMDFDLTCGAVFYANEKTMTSGWYKRNIIDSGKHPVVAVIGKQTFRT